MALKKKKIIVKGKDTQKSSPLDVDEIIEKSLEDIATLLCSSSGGKSRMYEEVLTMFERSLFKIALRRSSFVKSTAASYLGINRNTFQKKMVKLGIDCQKE